MKSRTCGVFLTLALGALTSVAVLPASATILEDAQIVCGDILPEDVPDLASIYWPTDLGNSGACPKLCDRWVTSCRGSVNALSACVKSGISKSFAIKNAECGTLPESVDKKACRGAAVADRNLAKATLLAGQDGGKLACITRVGDCVTFCGN